ncbi:MAG: serine hydroxymethyltransferase [Patescibacteria group bacterium]|nr:serine hydroxymethyltransferase [Patescibacteria group bacterium]MCL5262204.1 serine hydroxymethyltransferase [Patescibacteria group bacterium]
MKYKRLWDLVKKEERRQTRDVDLIASENYASDEVRELLGSVLVNKYSEGYPGKRYYPGNKYYDEIELLCEENALKAFHISPSKWHANVQPYSGSPANFAVYGALLEPGETILGMKLAAGGHLTHGHKVSFSGKFFRAVQYGVDEKTGLIDYGEIARLARKHKPKIIVSGISAYPRKINFKRISEIAKSVGAYHMADISHIAGLVAAGLHPSPFPWSDVVTTTTHKTLAGPRGAVIFCRRELVEEIDKAVFPGLQGGPHNNVTAAKCQMFYEAQQPGFKKYEEQIVKNARVLAEEFKKLGFVLVSGGTDNHLMLLDLKNFGVDGLTAEKLLEKNGIIANRNSVPGDTSPFKPSGIRIGTPAITRRGMKEKDMKLIAKRIYEILKKGK